MSLNWNATKVEGWGEIPVNKQESLIFATMFVDMGEITEKNHEEFYERYVQFNMACGYTDLYLSLADVKSAIGLSTNVFTTTPAAWRKRLIKKLEEKAREKLYIAKRDAAKAEEPAEEVSNAEG
jgi:hypothetical protein